MIRISNLSKKYEQTVALDNITIEFGEKGFVFVNGMSGSGKTTLMNLLSGLDFPTTGEIYYNGKDITKYNSNELDEYRNSQIGVVFQNFNLIDDMTVEENLMLPLAIQGVLKEKRNQLVEESLKYVGLAGFAKRKGYELSAGQKQRVAIARAIIKRPKVIFADEATGNLDPQNAEQILEIFNDISKRCLVILISHNDISATKYADRIITLDEGKICKDIDNRQIKELYLEPYKISIDGHGYNNEMYLEGFDIKVEIKKVNDKLGHKLDKYSFDTKISLEKEHKFINKNWINIGETEIKPMPFREKIQAISRIINKQRVRNILVVCLLAFIVLLFFIVNALNSNDYYMALSKYINNTNNTLYPVKMSVCTEDGKENDTFRGKSIYMGLRKLTDSNKIVECIGEVSLHNDIGAFYVTAFKYGDFFENIDISGIWPRKHNEIAVSRDFANSENIDVGEYIMDDTSELLVVGIYDFAKNMDRNNIVVSKEYNSVMLEEEKFISLQACDVLKSVSLDEYVGEISTIGNVANLKKDQLVWGRMPNKDNEIIISSNALIENSMTLEDGFVTKYRLPNLYEKKYQNAYDEFVNMYTYLGKKVEIVGIYDNDNLDYGEILIANDSYKKIIDFYKEYLDFELLYMFLDDDNYNVIKLMAENDIFLCDDMSTYIYAIQDFFNNMKNVMKTILIIMLIMVVFVIVSFLSYNVKYYSKTVGIYKSLGIKNIDIAKLFVLYNLQLSIISILISNLTLNRVIYFINKQICTTFDAINLEVFVLNDFNSVLLSFIILLISVVATVIPVFSLVKKESVTLINKDEY